MGINQDSSKFFNELINQSINQVFRELLANLRTYHPVDYWLQKLEKCHVNQTVNFLNPKNFD